MDQNERDCDDGAEVKVNGDAILLTLKMNEAHQARKASGLLKPKKGKGIYPS